MKSSTSSLPGAAYRHVLGYWELSSGELLQGLLYTDIKTYHVELLMKQNNMNMAASIKSRVTFLDLVLVEWATRVPAKFRCVEWWAADIEEGDGRLASTLDSLSLEAEIPDSLEPMAGRATIRCY
jgi:asparagine synthetase B (glutamine-hydrolysing)